VIKRQEERKGTERETGSEREKMASGRRGEKKEVYGCFNSESL